MKQRARQRPQTPALPRRKVLTLCGGNPTQPVARPVPPWGLVITMRTLSQYVFQSWSLEVLLKAPSSQPGERKGTQVPSGPAMICESSVGVSPRTVCPSTWPSTPFFRQMSHRYKSEHEVATISESVS
jgi:hypothetical protein